MRTVCFACSHAHKGFMFHPRRARKKASWTVFVFVFVWFVLLHNLCCAVTRRRAPAPSGRLRLRRVEVGLAARPLHAARQPRALRHGRGHLRRGRRVQRLGRDADDTAVRGGKARARGGVAHVAAVAPALRLERGEPPLEREVPAGGRAGRVRAAGRRWRAAGGPARLRGGLRAEEPHVARGPAAHALPARARRRVHHDGGRRGGAGQGTGLGRTCTCTPRHCITL